jgi:hypothetical protein
MSKQDKFGKKKSGVKFDRNKVYASSEVDILLADQAQQEYKENRGKERHSRRVQAGLEEDVTTADILKEKEKEKEEVKLNVKEPLNKYDLKRYGTAEEAEKYLYHCHTCGLDVVKGIEFCSDKCKEYIVTYGFDCKWSPDCTMCKFSKRVSKRDSNSDEDDSQ